MRVMLVLPIAIAIAAVVSCGNTEQGETVQPTYSADHIIETHGGYVAYAFSVTMKDGTKCVIVSGSLGKAAISCNWEIPK